MAYLIILFPIFKFLDCCYDSVAHSTSPFDSFPSWNGCQVERTNAILEDYLCHFVNLKQDDWSSWLPMAEFSFNNSPSTSTSHSPFFALHGFHPRFNTSTSASTVPRADNWLTSLHSVQEYLSSCLIHAKGRQAHFHNLHRRPADHYSPVI